MPKITFVQRLHKKKLFLSFSPDASGENAGFKTKNFFVT